MAGESFRKFCEELLKCLQKGGGLDRGLAEGIAEIGRQ
jgi:hypothetical protein